jgi:predicted  nucleic acid-binding Zn-ribbon protein
LRLFQAELSNCKERICVLESELNEIEGTFSQEKREIEEVLEKAGLDKTDLTGSVKDLNRLLQSALRRLYPQWPQDKPVEEDLLEKYIERHTNGDGVYHQ